MNYALPSWEQEMRQDVRENLFWFAESCLSIRTKTGSVEDFTANRVQRYLHEALEAQRAETGMVRALVLKGRQLGCSTYVAARYYHRAIHEGGQKVFILTHSDQATQNLFEIVDRFHQHCPAQFRPVTGNANAKELSFKELDSGYRVGTAGTKDVGRSATIQMLHGSEVAFWANAETHAAGIFQAVPQLAGSEIILESTANGFGNLFHAMWNDAQTGKGDYRAIFLPWFWHDEYTRPAPPGFKLEPEDEEYMLAYELSLDQMAWRRWKQQELKSDLLFRQEFPATAAEAFQLSGHDSFIPPSLLLKARKTRFMSPPSGPLVIGFDPAWKGDDRHSMAFRRGRRVLEVQSRKGLAVTESAGWMGHVIATQRPQKVFIDVGGVGAGVYDILVEQGFGEVVRPVNFGSPPLYLSQEDHGGPANRRAEMWQASKDWLADPAGVSIPDSDEIQADATAPAYSYNSASRLVLESKEHMRSRDVPSPDTWDAIALTFAEPVIDQHSALRPQRDTGYIV